MTRRLCVWLLFVISASTPALLAETPSVYRLPPAEVRKAFASLLDRPRIPLDVRQGPATLPLDGQIIERLSFASEKKADGHVERVPVLIIRPDGPTKRRPAVIVLHGTGGSKEGLKPWLVELAKEGIVAVAIDARYHGEREGASKGTEAYNDAITRAWRSPNGQPQEHPFYYDTCWDLWRTIDYLESRADVDPKRIGMFGISMGGIQTWLAAAVDERVAVAVPAIAVQSFRWSLEHDRWQGRARTIADAHEAAAKDLGEPEVNAKVCRALWEKVIPGILGPFDGPSMLRLFAGRPLLILNGENDPNCPIEGAEVAFSAALSAFKDVGASDRLKVSVAEGVGHTITLDQHRETLEWFRTWLKPTP